VARPAISFRNRQARAHELIDGKWDHRGAEVASHGILDRRRTRLSRAVPLFEHLCERAQADDGQFSGRAIERVAWLSCFCECVAILVARPLPAGRQTSYPSIELATIFPFRPELMTRGFSFPKTPKTVRHNQNENQLRI
jgi:hypothetical protein